MTTTHATTLPVLRISSSDHQRLRFLVERVIESQPRLRETLQPLRAELERADVLPAEIIPGNVVVMGSTVEIEDREGRHFLTEPVESI